MRLIAPMPLVVLNYGCKAVFEAIDPVTGNPVSGVTITDPALYGVNMSTDASTATVGDLANPVLLRSLAQ